MSRKLIIGKVLQSITVDKKLPYRHLTKHLLQLGPIYQVIIWKTVSGIITEVTRDNITIVMQPTLVRELDPIYWVETGVIKYNPL